MNRTTYFNSCEEKLSTLCTRIELRGKLNILDMHLHSEDFYLNLLNLLFGYSLQNINQVAHNVEAIDLVDNQNKIVVQVSATASKVKVQKTLSKNFDNYVGYTFKFVSISKDASKLRTISFNKPNTLIFWPQNDIYDIQTLLNEILHLEISKQADIYSFLKRELQSNDVNPIETNLAGVINILAKEHFANTDQDLTTEAFKIDKKLEFNNLNAATLIVEDYITQHPRIEKIYSEFDTWGQNKSRSVLNSFRQSYAQLSQEFTGDTLFFKIIDQATQTVKASANYNPMAEDELQMWVSALVVDAFIRCRIFKKPEGLTHAITPKHPSIE